MTFFYDLNKKLKEVADSSKSEHKQLNERNMREGSIQGGVWTATPPKAGQPNVPVPQNPEVAKPSKPASAPAAPGSAIRVDGKPIAAKEDSAASTMGQGLGTMVGSHPAVAGARTAYQAATSASDDFISGVKKGWDQTSPSNVAQSIKQSLSPTKSSTQAAVRKIDNATMKEAGVAMSAKQKKFAKLAPPKDKKITFADKIAGAKQEVDEMLGDVAAEAMKSALKGGQKKLDKNHNGKLDAQDFAMLRKGAGKSEEMDEDWDDMLKDVEKRRSKMKTGEKVQGHKGEIEKTDKGIKHTRRYDDKTGETDTGDDDTPKGEKRRGRPKGTGKAMGAKGPSGKSKLMSKEGFDITTPSGTFSTNTGTMKPPPVPEGKGKKKIEKEGFDITTPSGTFSTNTGKMTPPPMPESKGGDLKAAMALLKKAGYKVTKGDAKEPVEEKAVSKAQQRFMGMVHATQKGEKAPSKEVAKVAKSMGKKDAEDFAATKHKGLPEKKKKKTEEAGGVDTPTASSGFSFGKGIYDSINRELEEMIAESMNISMNTNSDGPNGPTKSLTVTATDEDAAYLAQILKSAGLGGSHGDCGCGESPCSCGSDAEHVDENKPDWPTNTEYSDDALQYSGGLNKPKTDVAGDGQTTVPVAAVHTQDEDDLRRLREMAGIKEAPDLNTTLGIKSAPTSAPTPYKGPDLNTTLGIKSTPASTPASTSTAPDINKLTINAMKESDDVEEGKKFTGNLAKARAAGKKEADLDGDGDMEKVQESILDMKHLWTAYKG